MHSSDLYILWHKMFFIYILLQSLWTKSPFLALKWWLRAPIYDLSFLGKEALKWARTRKESWDRVIGILWSWIFFRMHSFFDTKSLRLNWSTVAFRSLPFLLLIHRSRPFVDRWHVEIFLETKGEGCCVGKPVSRTTSSAIISVFQSLSTGPI